MLRHTGDIATNSISSTMHAKSFEGMMLESSLRHALRREEFVVNYQPLVNIDPREILESFQSPPLQVYFS